MVCSQVPLVRSARCREVTRRWLVLGPLAAAALVLAACGSDDATGTTTSTAGAAPTAEPTAEETATGSADATEPAPQTDDKVAATDSMMAVQPVEYVYEGDMPALDGPAPAWHWVPGRTPTTDAIAAVAAALGVAGDVIEQPADMGGGWAVGAEAGYRLSVSSDAQGSWSFIADVAPLCVGDSAATSSAAAGAVGAAEGETLPAVAPDAPVSDAAPADDPAAVAPPETVACVEPVGIPTADEATVTATELLQALGLDPAAYEITADSQEWGAWVDARLRVDGIAAPVLTSFGFGAEGALTFAAGQLLEPEPAGQYERIGTAAALEQLQADQFRSYEPVADPAATDVAPLPATEPAGPDTPVSSPETQSPVVDSGNPIESDAPIDPTGPTDASEPAEPITVVLTGVEAGWWVIWAADGTTWLLPGYDFVTDQGERISAPAIAQADLPVDPAIWDAEPQPGAGEAPAEADIAPPLSD
jgi:hypothetical protein